MRTLFALAVLATCASAQDFNIDVGDNLAGFPAPDNSYSGAVFQSGHWNALATPYSTALVDIAGNPTAITVSSNQPLAHNYTASTLTGNDRNLMIDVQRLPRESGPWTWTFSGLPWGSYWIATFAWSPDNDGAQTLVSVPGAYGGPELVGGTWNGGMHVFGVTCCLHTVFVTNGTITVEVQGQGTNPGQVNGFQIRRAGPPESAPTFCFGDGSGIPCPCGNAGDPWSGCANSVNTTGGRIAAYGSSSLSNDTILLRSTGMPDSFALYFQGTTRQNGGAGTAFGDGLRCAGGSVTRISTKLNVGGVSSYPEPGDPSLSVRGTVGAPGIRTYQCWYRNAASFCTPSTFNLTNGVELTWQP